jgi:hypothetical protein
MYIMVRVPIKYIPERLSWNDKRKQSRMLLRSRALYKQGKYYTRKRVSSYKQKSSKHVIHARKIYGVDKIVPGPELAKATGCSVAALREIVKKGEGAYYSSGSRPNQTAHSWGYARLASAITSGKSAAVDFAILEKGCDHKKRAYKMAVTAKRKHGYGQRKTRKVGI